MLDPGNKLPIFFAVDLGRLPPVDIEHFDVSAILSELQALCSEVRVVRDGKAAKVSGSAGDVKRKRTAINQLLSAYRPSLL